MADTAAPGGQLQYNLYQKMVSAISDQFGYHFLSDAMKQND